MDEIWGMMKLLFFAVYLFVSYVLASFVVVDSAVRLGFGFCGSRKGMAMALLLALPVTVWHLFLHVPRSTASDILALTLSALAVAGLVFWAQAMRHTPTESRHMVIEPLVIGAVSLFWLGMIIHAVLKRGFIAH